MSTQTKSACMEIDPAAVFGAALSLWTACHEYAKHRQINLSASFKGIDHLMRLAMRIGNQFETWACQHLNFNGLTDVWPYLLEEKFGKACLDLARLETLATFDDSDCLRVAMLLRLPLFPDDKLPVPVDVSAPNPIPNSPFRSFRIQSVRNSNEGGDVRVYTWDDEPFDDDFSEPYFGLYGVFDDGTVEHIADRKTYAEAVSLAKKLAPGIDFSAS